METLQIPVSLRSLDVSGRSLGTERLSSAPSGTGPEADGFARTLDAEMTPEAAQPALDSTGGAPMVAPSSSPMVEASPESPAPVEPEPAEQAVMLASLEDLAPEMVRMGMGMPIVDTTDQQPVSAPPSDGDVVPEPVQMTTMMATNGLHTHDDLGVGEESMDAVQKAQNAALPASTEAHPVQTTAPEGAPDQGEMGAYAGTEGAVTDHQMDSVNAPEIQDTGQAVGPEDMGIGTEKAAKYGATGVDVGVGSPQASAGATPGELSGPANAMHVDDNGLLAMPNLADGSMSSAEGDNFISSSSAAPGAAPLEPAIEPETAPELVTGKPAGPEQAAMAAGAPVPDPTAATKPTTATSPAHQSEPVDPAQPLSDASEPAGLSELDSQVADTASASTDDQAPTAAIARDGAAPEMRAEHSLNSSTSAERAAEPSRAGGPTGASVAEGRPSPEAIERAERILGQVRLQLRPDMRQATLELRPASLGHISIQLEVAEGEVTAVIRADRPETLSVLERHLPELRSMFQQSGVDVADLDLGLGSQADGEAEMGDTQNGQRGRPNDAAPAMEIEQPLESALATRIGELGVDTYA